MNRLVKGLCATSVAALLAGGTEGASIGITVTPWLAPNVFGSPSFPGAVSNAIEGQLAGSPSFGTPGTPTYYQAQSNVSSAQAIVTGFPSWLGVADPGTAFGAPFAAELGNRMHFGILALGNGVQFSVGQLGFSATSTDPFNALAFGFSVGAYNYSLQLQGILYGGDGQFGGGDDTYITAGAADQLVDGLVGRGSGNSFAAYCPGCTIEQQQAAIDAAAAYPGGPFDFTGVYTIGEYEGSGTFHINPVPEPSSLVLLAGVIASLLLAAAPPKRRARVRA
jgi:hypothetical protein